MVLLGIADLAYAGRVAVALVQDDADALFERAQAYPLALVLAFGACVGGAALSSDGIDIGAAFVVAVICAIASFAVISLWPRRPNVVWMSLGLALVPALAAGAAGWGP